MTNTGIVTATANANAIANGAVTAISGEEIAFGTAVASASVVGMRQFAGRAGVDAGVNVAQWMTTRHVEVGAHAFAGAPGTTTANDVLPVGAAFAFAAAVGAAQYNAATGTNTQPFETVARSM